MKNYSFRAWRRHRNHKATAFYEFMVDGVSELVTDVRKSPTTTASRSLANVEAYDPEVKNEFMVAVSDFENVLFALLDELESLKDSPLASIVTILIYSESGSIIREMPLSEVIPAVHVAAERKGLCVPFSFASGGVFIPAPPQDSSLGIADYQVSTLTLITDEVPSTTLAVA
ncbi:hypothetical protein Tco_0686561 [Tanacetum coccineum]